MKSTKILFLILVLAFLTGFLTLFSIQAQGALTIVSSDDPVSTISAQLSFILLNQDPDPVRPGDVVEVRFKLENDAQETYSNVEVEILPEYRFTLYSGTGLKNLGKIRASQTGRDAIILSWKLKVDP